MANNDDDLLAKAKAKFDHEQLLSDAKAKFDTENASNRPFAAGIEAAGDTLALGYLPQIKAGTAEVFSKVGVPRETTLAVIDKPIPEVITGRAFKDLAPLNSYVETRDAAIKSSKDLARANPLASGLGTLTGAVLPLGLGAASTGGILKQIAKSGLKTAGTGFAYNPGDIQGEMGGPQLSERLGNAVISGGLGTLLAIPAKTAEAIAPALEKYSPNIANWTANKLSFGLGAPLIQKGLSNLSSVVDKLSVLDQPIAAGKLNGAILQNNNEASALSEAMQRRLNKNQSLVRVD
jgi:hypothetical protein